MVSESEDSLKIKRNWCSLNQDGWFVVLGVLLIVTAFLHGVIYFSIRTLTTSLDLVETVPNYATALLVCCTGILVLFLSKRRDLAFVVPTIILGLVCVGLCASSAILTWLKVLAPMSSFSFCSYRPTEGQCRCYIIDETRSAIQNQNNTILWPGTDKVYVYKSSRSCHAIEYNLKDLVITQCVLYSTDFALCVMALFLIAYFIRKNMVPMSICPPQRGEESEDELPLALLDSSSSSYDWCNNYLYRQMALPGMESYTATSSQSSRPPEYPGQCSSQSCCCCHCHSNCSTPVRQVPHQRCQVTELADNAENNANNVRSDRNISCTNIVPLYPPNATASARQNVVSRNNSRAGNSGNSVALLHYTRHQEGIPAPTNQNESPAQNNQIVPYVHNNNASRPPHRYASNNSTRRCHQCHHSQRHRSRTRSRRTRTGLATMMPLSAWNLRRMQYPLPLEPPPPYRPWQLPPYLEDDPAPSYRSRATTPANSVCGALE